MYVILGNMILSCGLELDAGVSARIAATGRIFDTCQGFCHTAAKAKLIGTN